MPTASTSSGLAVRMGSESEWRTDAMMSSTSLPWSGEIWSDSEITDELTRWGADDDEVEAGRSLSLRREVRVWVASGKMSFGRGIRPCSNGSRRGWM